MHGLDQILHYEYLKYVSNDNTGKVYIAVIIIVLERILAILIQQNRQIVPSDWYDAFNTKFSCLFVIQQLRNKLNMMFKINF